MSIRLVCADKSLVDGPGYLDETANYQVGRSSKCRFILSDLSVSRVHAEIIVNEKRIRVKDLNSYNGTFVDGVRVNEADVRPGQSLQFGSTRFHVVDDRDNNVTPDEISEVSTHFMNTKAKNELSFLACLSPQEKRVVEGLFMGISRKEVASNLGIRPNTACNHIKRIYEKLGVNSRAELMVLLMKEKEKA
jgi:DNA-binding CsgD family transcriptional regulator